MCSFLCLIVYMARVTREVGKKMFPASAIDEPLFYYNYGYSFVAVMAAFLCTELSAVLILSVYMAKHDEQIYNKYHIRSLFKSQVLGKFTIGMIRASQPSALEPPVPNSSLNTPRGSSSGRVSRSDIIRD